MFSTLPQFSRLIAGCVLALLSVFAQAQTLAGVQALMKDGKMAQALEAADRYIAARPQDAQGPFAKGLILSEMGRAQEAIQVFSGLAERFPGLPEPHNNLAVLYAQQKQYDKAQAALEAALRTHPSYAVAYENLGGLYARLASQAYDKALQLDSSSRTQTPLAMIPELAVSSGGKMASAKPAGEPTVSPTASPTIPATIPTIPTPVSPPVSTPTTVAVAGTTPGKPVEAPAIAKTDADRKTEGAEKEIARIVRDWADAWSRKDVKAYLAFYAGNFQTPRGMTFRKWEEERRQRIDRPGKLQVGVGDLKVSVSGDTATARFRQQYVSSSLKSQTGKTLVFAKSGARWLIVQERVN